MKINNAYTSATNYNKYSATSFKGASNRIVNSKIVKFLEPNRKGDMSRNMFVVTAFTFLLGSRLIASRDNNERRETLLRDLPTFVLAVKGVPFFENLVGKTAQKKTGFAILQEPNNHKAGLASYDQLKDWYIYEPKTATGFKGFSQRLSNQGGNLKKIFSYLSPEIKNKLQNFSNENDKFMSELSKDSKLQKTVAQEFAKSGNKAAEQASFLRSMPKISGFLVTLSLIGIFIPKFNIHLTRQLNKKTQEPQPNKNCSDSENTTKKA